MASKVIKASKATSVPTGVKIVSILLWALALIYVGWGVWAIFAGSALGGLADGEGGAAGIAAGILAAIIMWAFAVLFFFVGKGLWNGRQWARIVSIVLAALYLVLVVFSLMLSIVSGAVRSTLSDILQIIIALIIGGYLLFSKDAKVAFK